MKPDLDDVARVLIAAGYAPFREDQEKAGGFRLYEVGDLATLYHWPSTLSPHDPLVENDLCITGYARALKARGYLVEPRISYVKDQIEHHLWVTLKD